VQELARLLQEWGEVCSAYGGEEWCIQGFGGENGGKDPSVDEEDNIKIDIEEVECGGMDWIELFHNRDSWWVLVNAVMNLRVP